MLIRIRKKKKRQNQQQTHIQITAINGCIYRGIVAFNFMLEIAVHTHIHRKLSIFISEND